MQKSFTFGAMLIAASQLIASAESALIAIDATKPGPTINSNFYGFFLEEINHGVDGGLYAELIRNRGFEDARPPEGYEFKNGRWQNRQGFDSGFSRYGYTTNGAPFWSLIQSGDAKGRMKLETTGGITEASAYCLRLEAEAVGNGRLAWRMKASSASVSGRVRNTGCRFMLCAEGKVQRHGGRALGEWQR